MITRERPRKWLLEEVTEATTTRGHVLKMQKYARMTEETGEDCIRTNNDLSREGVATCYDLVNGVQSKVLKQAAQPPDNIGYCKVG